MSEIVLNLGRTISDVFFICEDTMQDKEDLSIRRFNLLTSEIDNAYHDAAKRMGLTDSATLILYALAEAGGSCLLSDLARRSGVSKQTLNSALRRLEADGLTELFAVDGRKKRLMLTDAGRVLAEKTVCRLIDIENEIFSSWTEDEQRLYFLLTQRWLTQFREKMGELSV